MEWNHWIALALVGAAVWSAWLRVKRSRAIKAMASWRQVEGRVLSHSIEETSSTDSEGDSTDHFDPKIGYAYEVDGKSYSGTRLAFEEPSFSSRKKAQAYLDQRPVGSTIAIFVNPANPVESVHTVRAKAGWGVPILFLALAAAVSLGLIGGGETS